MYTNFLLLYSRIGDSSEEDNRESETGNTEQVGRGEEVSLNIFPTTNKHTHNVLISLARISTPEKEKVVDLITPATTPLQSRSPSPGNPTSHKTMEDMAKNSTVVKGPEMEKTKEETESVSDTENMDTMDPMDPADILKQEMEEGEQELEDTE